MKKQNITKTLTSLAALSLTAALMLTFPGCQASRTSGQPDTTPQDTTPRNTTPQDTEAHHGAGGDLEAGGDHH